MPSSAKTENHAPSDRWSADFILRLRQSVLKRVKNKADAEDILQEVLTKILRKGADVKEAAFLAWVNRVAVNAVMDHYRKQSSRKESGSEELENFADGKDESDTQTDPKEILAGCLPALMKCLDPSDQALIEQVEFNGESQKDIAKRQGVPYSTLKSQLQKARSNLKKQVLRCCKVTLDQRNSVVDIDSDCEDGKCGE